LASKTTIVGVEDKHLLAICIRNVLCPIIVNRYIDWFLERTSTRWTDKPGTTIGQVKNAKSVATSVDYVDCALINGYAVWLLDELALIFFTTEHKVAKALLCRSYVQR
jgi:hypothetical protein